MWSSTKNLFLQTYHTSVTIMLHCYMYMYMVCRIRSNLDFTTVPQNASYVTTSTDLKKCHVAIPPRLLPPSPVYDPTTSFNPFFFHSSITPPFYHLVT